MTRAAILQGIALACLATPAAGHSWYEGRCCSSQDCHPVSECIMPDGKQGLEYLPGACSRIDWSKVQVLPAPDGQWHACIPPKRIKGGDIGDALRCIYAPGAA